MPHRPRSMKTCEGENLNRFNVYREAKAIISERLADSRQLYTEYGHVLQLDQKIEHHVSDSQTPEASTRNRYINVLPYNFNRVHLTGAPSYVNASYIQHQDEQASQQFVYVATQGPLPSTVPDFWRMVLQHRPPAIIMLSGIVERGSVKCAQYFPASQGATMDVGAGISVTCIDVKDQAGSSHMTVRTLAVTNSSTSPPDSWTVTHLQYNGWPDHGAPVEGQTIRDMCNMLNDMRQAVNQPSTSGRAQANASTPLESQTHAIVHCSAGVGRTGTFLALDILRTRIFALANDAQTSGLQGSDLNNELQQALDLPALVHSLRQQRMMMVQTFEQYQFIYQALLEELQAVLAAQGMQ